MKYVLCALLILAAGTIFTMRDFIFPQTWKYKITIEVETPEVVKSGSAVRHIKARRNLAGFIGQGIISYETIGEAVVVDLGEKGLLFGLIDDTDYSLLENAFKRSLHDAKEHMYYFANLPVGTKRDLIVRQPKMVMFEDITDPKTIKLVHIKTRVLRDVIHEDYFVEIYGEGFSLKAVTLEMVDEPVTELVKALLPSFGRVPRKINLYDFKRGER